MLIYVFDLFDGGAEAPKAPPWIRHCIYIIYRFYTDFSLFRQIKRQDTVIECCDDGAAMAHNHFLFPDHCKYCIFYGEKELEF